MARILFTWIGNADLGAIAGDDTGPILKGVQFIGPDRLILLSAHPRGPVRAYLRWLEPLVPSVDASVVHASLKSPTDLQSIYETAVATIGANSNAADDDLWFHTSLGTPAMATVWILLAKARYCWSPPLRPAPRN